MSRTEAPKYGAQVREATRRTLMDAAVELLSAKGSAGLTMTAVARRADLAVRTVYNHFASVDELVTAALADVVERFEALRPSTPDAEGTALDALSAFVERWFTELADCSVSIDALFSYRGSERLETELAAAGRLRMSYLRTVFSWAHERGELRVSVDDAAVLAYTLVNYQTWRALVSQLGMTTTDAIRTVVEWLTRYAFSSENASLDPRTSQPGGRVGTADEESPDSVGQGGG